MTESRAETVVEGIYKDMERRIAASPPGICPVDLTWAFLKMCHAQTCGKCVPCRIGLGQLALLLEQVLSGTATMSTLVTIEKTARQPDGGRDEASRHHGDPRKARKSGQVHF